MPLYEIDGRRPTLPDDDSAWIAPSAELIGDVVIEREVSVWFGAVIRADNTEIRVGRGTNVQEGAMLHSDPDAPLCVGEGVTIGHHAVLHGCTIGANVLIGMGAVILNNAIVAENSIVGAGSLIPEGKSFAPGSVIIGAPAKAVRSLDEAGIASLRDSAEIYDNKRKLFAKRLRRVDEDESGLGA